MNILGTQMRYVTEVFQSTARTADAGGMTAAELNKRLQLARDYTKVVMQVVISVIGLGGSIALLLLDHRDGATTKVACSTIGLITGYWLR